jgi:hypothetical protein
MVCLILHISRGLKLWKLTSEFVIYAVVLFFPITVILFPLSPAYGVSEWSSTTTDTSFQRNSYYTPEEVSLFAYISGLPTWSVGPSQYGVTEVHIVFNFTMYNRMGSPQIFTWANMCEFAPYGTGVLEVENLTFSSYYGCCEAIFPATYSPGFTNRSRHYAFRLSEPGYTELPDGSYRFDTLDPNYLIPSFPTFGVTLIINETGFFRLYDAIPSSLFSPFSEPPRNETSSHSSSLSNTSFVSSTELPTEIPTFVDDWDTRYDVLSLIVFLLLLIPFKRRVTGVRSRGMWRQYSE